MVPLISAFLAANARIATRVNVRFGSKADISACVRDVRFTPESGHFRRAHDAPARARDAAAALIFFDTFSKGPGYVAKLRARLNIFDLF